MFIDTHAHLNFESFDADRDAVIRRAVNAGVDKIIVPSVDEKSSLLAIDLAEQYPQVYAAVGIHPQDAQDYSENRIQTFYDWATHPKVVAIGEIGIDYYRDYNPRDLQIQVFQRFIRLAQETNLPVIIHNREADSDILPIVENKEFKSVTGVFHCFSSDLPTAHRVLKAGYLISFTGTITFKKSESATVLRELPLEKLMIETDSPFLAPTPFRGKRNEPAFVRHVAEKFSAVKKVPLEEIARITTQNAYGLFPKLKNA